jgi:peptide deformylase
MKLVPYTDPILKEIIPDFDVLNNSEKAVDFAWHLAQFMIESGGIGLAANQIGERIRAFALASNPIIVMYNPVIVDFTMEDLVTLEESCLSYPGLIVKVTRPKSIKIRYTLPNGEVKTDKFTGITARVIQHEMEHLDGKRFFDNVEWWESEKVKKWMKKAKRKNQNG